MKQEKLELIIPKKSTGKRIDIALQELMSDYSRRSFKHGLNQDLFYLIAKKSHQKTLSLGGERVSVSKFNKMKKSYNSKQKIFHSI